ncbi:MAG: leucine--tRNA ligase [Sulfolobales archaeon]|nr:leucine--tRNA ligase [Sulfolobales archaeon]MCX8198764.1 leucine--tRNA ligase [Sulfolobales archaeon]MDW8169837.1 leucine--tRNA ligase [Desulfurococcaceae archaeon]
MQISEELRNFIKRLTEASCKWSVKWVNEGVFEASPLDKPKFFITAAFPYPNGVMHLGHARTYTIADVYARFIRMIGYNVLFPMGFHYTGTPVLSMADAIRERDQQTIKLFRDVYGIPPEVIEKMSDPMFMVKYFHEEMKESMKILGLSIDWRREFTSIDKDFSSFIKWQFTKLFNKSYITKGTHPVGWDPVIGTPVGMHDTKGDVEPEVEKFTLLYFKDSSEAIYPAATLRPETVFGAVNVWVNPSGTYVEAVVDGVKWVVSIEAVEKLRLQLHEVSVLREFKGGELLGKRLRNPATGAFIPILPAEFVDTDTATGIVMSVPAHAPYDYAALREFVQREELIEKIGVNIDELKPVSVIELPGGLKAMAIEIVEKMNISSHDYSKLDEATREVYREELKHGFMLNDIVSRIKPDLLKEYGENYINEVSTEICGKPVNVARVKTVEILSKRGLALEMYEVVNKPVYSRWGNKVAVKILENQWFIDYSNVEWKNLAREASKNINIVPEELRSEFYEAVEWVGKRACARTRGLGTKLPWDEGWVIESLSDSTIYMAFYTVNYLLRRSGVRAEQLTEEVWNYIALGEGDPVELSKKTSIPIEVLVKAREEFDYWYPVDSRHSGKDLIKNHLTFYIYNHVAIFPRDKWPKQIVVNGYILYRGQKMSKSLLNVVPARKLINEISPDGLRLSLAMLSEVDQDLDFSEDAAITVVQQLQKIYELIASQVKVIKLSNEIPKNMGLEDLWILAKTKALVESIKEDLSRVRIRSAATKIYYVFENYIRTYLELLKFKKNKVGDVSAVIKKIVESWIKIMNPFTPYLAEELWRMIGGEGYVSLQEWPSIEDLPGMSEALLAFEYLERLISDVREITKLYEKKPSKITIAVAPREYYNLLRKAVNYITQGRGVREFIKDVVSEARDKEWAANYSRRVYEVASSLQSDVLKLILKADLDEKGIISEMKEWIESQLGALIELSVMDVRAGGLKKIALPFRPAIFIEFSEQ